MSVQGSDARQDSWSDLRARLVLQAGAVLTAVAWFGWYRALVSPGWDGRVVVLTIAAAALILLAAARARAHPLRSAVLLAGLSFGGAWLALAMPGQPVAALLFVLPILLAGFTIHPFAALPTALLAGLVVWLGPTSLRPTAWAYHLLDFATAAVSLLWARDLKGTLMDAWGYTEDTGTLVREVRARQEEINRLNQALRVSNGLLKRSLSELALAQREAEDARHLKEQFATTVSHELRTPLNIILGFVDVMQHYPEVYGDVNWTPTLRRDLGEIQRSADYLSSLVDDILDLARVHALKMPIHREPTDLAALVQEVVGLASRLLLDRERVTLLAEVPDGLPRLYVDPTRIRQVLLNLLANACRFTEAGRIVVRGALGADEVVLTVTDTGPGISPDLLESIFDEFQQGERLGPEEQHAGKGLGLAIARRFVHMHGGRMWAESQVGKGSAFHFSLPLAPKQISPLHPAATAATEIALGRPLVVAVGGPEAGEYLTRHLEGFEVAAVGDLTEARKVVRERHARAVIVSVPPEPEEATHGLAPPILPEPVPVVQCSFPAGTWTAEQELFDDWLVKPVDGERLLAAVVRLGTVKRVLVVDDDRAFVRLMRRLFEAGATEIQVLSASDGREALAALERQPVDLVLLDLSLPDMNGRSVAQALRRMEPDRQPAIIAVTALQPGLEGPALQPRTFSVTTAGGFTEDEGLELLRFCLGRLRPAYLTESLLAEPQEAPAG